MNLVAPFGFYGWGNIGDESTLQGFARLVSRYDNGMRVWVASRNPSHTAKVEPSFKYYKAVGRDLRRRWAGYRATAAVVAGGTPIMDVLGAWPLCELVPLIQNVHRRGRPIAFLGTGTERLQRQESRRLVSEQLAPCVHHWTVRCGRDKDRLTDYGVCPDRITVAADLAWMLDPVSSHFGRHYLTKLGVNSDTILVGVNVNNETFVLKQEPRLFEKLASLLDRLVEKFGAHILFLCNEVRESESFDKAASLKVLASMQYRNRTLLVPNHYWTPQEMQSLIACCHMTMSTRYHFCLFSAIQSVPFIALKRSDKVADLCWDMNWSYAASPGEINVPTLFDMFSDIDQARSAWVAWLCDRTRSMREKALRNAVALDALFGERVK
jgi:polysaccharide pyruvyl transferase WcaK-like protein